MDGETTSTIAINSERGRNALAAAVFLVLGLSLLVYRGPGWEFLRGTVGDVLVVGFMYFGSGALVPSWPVVRLAGVGSIAVGLEFLQLYQLVDASDPLVLRLALGTTFDPADLVAYGIGLTAAWGVESLLEAYQRS